MERRHMRTRSISGYSDDIKGRARAAYMRWAFMSDHFKPDHPLIKLIEDGQHDDLPLLAAFAYLIDANDKAMVLAGEKCEGCGSAWDNERLASEKANNPLLVSCCPERRMKPVYWCSGGA